ncbi:MAG: hypothetical protein ACREN5_03890 [Gemmatimonadales bacterium]
MSARRAMVLAALVVSVGTAGLASQQEIPAGARVRLRIQASRNAPFAPDTNTIFLRGRALGASGGVLLVERESDRDTVRVPLDSVRRLEVVVGRRHPIREGAILGAILGTAVGAAIGVTVDECPNGEFMCFNARPVRSPVIGGAIGAPIGAAVGALAAQFIEVEHWGRLRPQGFSITVLPHPGGAALGAMIAF